VQFGLGAVLQYSSTPSLRLAEFEDEDSLPDEAFGVHGDSSCGYRSWNDEYENEAPGEVPGDHIPPNLIRTFNLKPRA
jgi:hypothetical protein